MTPEEIYQGWYVGLAVAAVVVVVVAALLITVIALCRRIAALAQAALGLVEKIEQNTKPIWSINATNKIAGDLLQGARAIEGNARAIVRALSQTDEDRAA